MGTPTANPIQLGARDVQVVAQEFEGWRPRATVNGEGQGLESLSPEDSVKGGRTRMPEGVSHSVGQKPMERQAERFLVT